LPPGSPLLLPRTSRASKPPIGTCWLSGLPALPAGAFVDARARGAFVGRVTQTLTKLAGLPHELTALVGEYCELTPLAA
jgi:hypothetical protein